jgi:hypothetical protein
MSQLERRWRTILMRILGGEIAVICFFLILIVWGSAPA